MGLFAAEEEGALERVGHFMLTTCGAELNVAIGLSRLGHETAYLTKLGRDLFGERIAEEIRASGISDEHILYSDYYHTGFMFKSKVNSGDPGIFYMRKGSAASTLCAQDLNRLDFNDFDLVHITGITPALTEDTADMAWMINHRAHTYGCLFSFDPNLRLQLWPSQAVMVEYINAMASKSDLFFPGVDEAEVLMGSRDPEQIAEYYLSLNTGVVIVKNGPLGAYFAAQSGERGYIEGFHVPHVVDTVGAGDGFAAGVISALREGLALREAVSRGCAVGAIQVMSRGDNDGLPNRTELLDFMRGKPDWRIQNDV